MYSIDTIAEITRGKFLFRAQETGIDTLVYDSRRIHQPSTSLFFALRSGHRNGHLFLEDAFKKGIRNFIVSEPVTDLGECNVIQVTDTLQALQQLAASHRARFSIPVIGITGSNGKTIVKEWLYQLLHTDHHIARSPRSYNSQVGVPLSVWQLKPEHTLGIFEAGISKPGEMKNLQQIIQPTTGVLTNIGEAHSEGFENMRQKIEEKMILFENADVVIHDADDENITGALKPLWEAGFGVSNKPVSFSWGSNVAAGFHILKIEKANGQTTIDGRCGDKEISFSIPFTDDASAENALACCCVMLQMNYGAEVIRTRMARLQAIDMRLQLRQSFNDCMVINDSYSNDITSLRIALDFLQQQGAGFTKTVILSEFFESDQPDIQLYAETAQLFRLYGINKAIVIGEKIGVHLSAIPFDNMVLQAYLSTDDFLKDFRSSQFFHEIILIKGARRFGFERIAQLFERKVHQTVLEIDLDALANNLKYHQQMLQPGTKVMAMVKAFSYGSGGAEIASVLQYHNTNYLGVAYADEGVDLVKAGIRLPVMVMNTEVSSFQSIIDYNLEPVIYSFDILYKFESYIRHQGLSHYPVHLEIETGMNRLGFPVKDVARLAAHLSSGSLFRVRSVFTHLAASEDPSQDEFTRQQSQLFQEAIIQIEKFIDYPFLKHIANSAAIVRHPDLQWDMVRLGIGLYGVETAGGLMPGLQAVARLKSTIAQLKKVKTGESVSYNRRGMVTRDSIIATVRIGYADGYSRQFGNGRGRMLIKGHLVPVIGTVCMDMTMIDVTDIQGVREGDDVIIFGPELPVQQVASWIGTISYEIMTGISQRVKRIYFHE